MRRWALLLALAGCTAAAPPATVPQSAQPVAVTLYRDTVTVSFSDGALCTAPRTASVGWSTILQGCPHAWPVTVAEPTRQPRLPLARAAGAPWVILQSPEGALGYAPQGASS